MLLGHLVPGTQAMQVLFTEYGESCNHSRTDTAVSLVSAPSRRLISNPSIIFLASAVGHSVRKHVSRAMARLRVHPTTSRVS